MSTHLAHGHTPAEEASQGRAVRRTAAMTLEMRMASLPKLGASEWSLRCGPCQRGGRIGRGSMRRLRHPLESTRARTFGRRQSFSTFRVTRGEALLAARARPPSAVDSAPTRPLGGRCSRSTELPAGKSCRRAELCSALPHWFHLRDRPISLCIDSGRRWRPCSREWSRSSGRSRLEIPRAPRRWPCRAPSRSRRTPRS